MPDSGLQLETPLVRRWLEYTPRGDSLDPLICRWHAARALVSGLTWQGAGPGATEKAIQRYAAIHRLTVPFGPAFNEPLQFVYEYGIAGALALALFCWPIVTRLHAHDPWSAAWVIGAVLTLGHWPCRLPQVGLVWLAISAKVVSE